VIPNKPKTACEKCIPVNKKKRVPLTVEPHDIGTLHHSTN